MFVLCCKCCSIIDNEDFELPSASGGLTNNWEGEDEDLNNVKVRYCRPLEKSRL